MGKLKKSTFRDSETCEREKEREVEEATTVEGQKCKEWESAISLFATYSAGITCREVTGVDSLSLSDVDEDVKVVLVLCRSQRLRRGVEVTSLVDGFYFVAAFGAEPLTALVTFR